MVISGLKWNFYINIQNPVLFVKSAYVPAPSQTFLRQLWSFDLNLRQWRSIRVHYGMAHQSAALIFSRSPSSEGRTLSKRSPFFLQFLSRSTASLSGSRS